MKALILPVLIILLAVGAGLGAGLVMRPEPEVVEGEDSEEQVEEQIEDSDAAPEFVKLNNQFVVPLVQEDGIKGLVVLSISVEVVAGARSVVHEKEPKLRDALTTALFRHANTGGFDGVFTSTPKMNALRLTLTESARNVLGDSVLNILVTDLVRRDA